MPQTVTFKDYLKLHFVVILLGFTAILGRLTEVSSLGIVLTRTLIAVIGLGIVLRYRKISLVLPKKELLELLGVGALVAAHWLCFFGSARVATVAISLVCFSTTSFFTSLIEPLFHKKAVSWVEVFLGVLVVIGICFVFSFESQYLTGILIGLLGAFLAAVFSVLNVSIARKHQAQVVTFYEMLGAFLTASLIIPFLLWSDTTSNIQIFPSPSDWKWLLILGLVCTVYAYSEMVNLLKKISAFTLNLSINLEPIYGIVLAYFIFGEKERMTGGFYIGAAFILATVILHPILSTKNRPSA